MNLKHSHLLLVGFLVLTLSACAQPQVTIEMDTLTTSSDVQGGDLPDLSADDDLEAMDGEASYVFYALPVEGSDPLQWQINSISGDGEYQVHFTVDAPERHWTSLEGHRLILQGNAGVDIFDLSN